MSAAFTGEQGVKVNKITLLSHLDTIVLLSYLCDIAIGVNIVYVYCI